MSQLAWYTTDVAYRDEQVTCGSRTALWDHAIQLALWWASACKERHRVIGGVVVIPDSVAPGKPVLIIADADVKGIMREGPLSGILTGQGTS